MDIVACKTLKERERERVANKTNQSEEGRALLANKKNKKETN
jgi:hypothetical protein